jgi:hypothetical protein
MKKRYVVASLGCAVFAAGVYAADHGDTPELISLGRHDGRITDLHAWRSGSSFVMSLCTNPNIPVGATSYVFPEDLTLRFHIDNTSVIDFSDPPLSSKYGGRIVDPSKVTANITLEFSFGPNGAPILYTQGLSATAQSHIQVYAGLRDDPFINGRRDGRNTACVVVQMPLADIQGAVPSLLTWATSKVPDLHGPISEHGGRALRSQFTENLALNTLRPRAQWTELEMVPDVMIHDLNAPSGFPNGRLLTDDVIDLVGDLRLVNDLVAQAVTANDKPLLPSFPYLSDPH